MRNLLNDIDVIVDSGDCISRIIGHERVAWNPDDDFSEHAALVESAGAELKAAVAPIRAAKKAEILAYREAKKAARDEADRQTEATFAGRKIRAAHEG